MCLLKDLLNWCTVADATSCFTEIFGGWPLAFVQALQRIHLANKETVHCVSDSRSSQLLDAKKQISMRLGLHRVVLFGSGWLFGRLGLMLLISSAFLLGMLLPWTLRKSCLSYTATWLNSFPTETVQRHREVNYGHGLMMWSLLLHALARFWP